MDRINKTGAGFQSLTEAIDTTIPAGRRPKLRQDQRKDIAENVISERKSGADMARLYNVSEATISRIVAHHRHAVA